MKSQTIPTRRVRGFRRAAVIRQLLSRDKTPLTILLLASLTGVLAGLAGVAFEKAVAWVTAHRIEGLAQVAYNPWLVWPLAFLFSALLAMVGYFLVRRFAPEAGGSGIPEIEGALEELRPVRWWRVLPVKFFGGMGTLGAGMVLGREGPMVQMGGNIGRMVLDIFHRPDAEARHTLLATGAAAGLAAAFNAPLAGILFIIEEMRTQFHYNLISIKAVFTGVIMSTIVFRIFNGEKSVIEVGQLTTRQFIRSGSICCWGLFSVPWGRCLTVWCSGCRMCSRVFTAAILPAGCCSAARLAARVVCLHCGSLRRQAAGLV